MRSSEPWIAFDLLGTSPPLRRTSKPCARTRPGWERTAREQLQAAVDQFPGVEQARRKRPTFAGGEPFEAEKDSAQPLELYSRGSENLGREQLVASIPDRHPRARSRRPWGSVARHSGAAARGSRRRSRRLGLFPRCHELRAARSQVSHRRRLLRRTEPEPRRHRHRGATARLARRPHPRRRDP